VFDFFLDGSFWSGSTAIFTVGGVAALLILLWDWRLLLPGLALIQYSVGQILIHRYGVPGQWLGIYFWVVLLAALILALAPIQIRTYQREGQGSGLLFRGLLLLLLTVIIASIPINFPLPVLDVSTARFFVWLAAAALLILALTDNPLFVGIGLLLWFIPIQSLLALLVPLPALIGLLGTLVLTVSLACSYLVVADSEQVAQQEIPATDLSFPTQESAKHSLLPDVAWLRQLVVRQMATISAVLKRVTQ
jgi:hypothetical protein